ncbi:MAG: TlpA family protein disulfide reductase [Bacteroidetes bacterium]|nr:MAG: TlpA family protein disulfide reductase [Bacteroidota bacterium]
MKRFGIFISLMFIAFSAITGNFEISVSGNFPGAEGREIRLLQYGDLITYREVEIASTLIDEQGNFSFRFSRFEPLYLFFRIDHARTGMFAEPGQDYHLQWDSVDFSRLDDRINPYLNPWNFNYTLSEQGDLLNSSIDEFEEVLYEKLTEQFVLIQMTRNAGLLDNIRQHTDSLFGHIDNSYFRDYYRYTYAYYQQVANLGRFGNLVQEFILNQPVLYHNTQYMNFFNTVFDTYIFAGSRSITGHDLRYTINELNSYHALMDSLGKDTILRNEVIRELVMLKGLQDLHGNPDYKQSHVENILQWVKENSKFPQHRTIAGNILYNKGHLKEGSQLPAFKLHNDTGKVISFPDDYEGKYLYIGFWASWCESCLLDFIALREIYREHKDNLAIVAVSTDRDKQALNRFMQHHNFPWETLHFDGDFRLLDTYQVRGIPLYILADRNGKVVSFPARRPAGELKIYLEWLLHQERRPRR